MSFLREKIVRAKFMREVAALGLSRGRGPEISINAVAEGDIAVLPDPVRRYLQYMGVVGRPRDWSFRLSFTGSFRRSTKTAWMKCETWQYNTRLNVARVFHIRARMAGLIPVLARDAYVQGKGRMLIRLFDLFTVGDGTGEEYDLGELATYLNDGIMIAPSMLLVPEVRWSAVDAGSFDVALTDHGHTVSARVFLDEKGAPVNFSTTDRFAADPQDAKRLQRARWTTPMEGWQEIAGRRLPTRGRALWHLTEGEFSYADFSPVPDSLAFNLPPGE